MDIYRNFGKNIERNIIFISLIFNSIFTRKLSLSLVYIYLKVSSQNYKNADPTFSKKITRKLILLLTTTEQCLSDK